MVQNTKEALNKLFSVWIFRKMDILIFVKQNLRQSGKKKERGERERENVFR